MAQANNHAQGAHVGAAIHAGPAAVIAAAADQSGFVLQQTPLQHPVPANLNNDMPPQAPHRQDPAAPAPQQPAPAVHPGQPLLHGEAIGRLEATVGALQSQELQPVWMQIPWPKNWLDCSTTRELGSRTPQRQLLQPKISAAVATINTTTKSNRLHLRQQRRARGSNNRDNTVEQGRHATIFCNAKNATIPAERHESLRKTKRAHTFITNNYRRCPPRSPPLLASQLGVSALRSLPPPRER